MIEKEKIEIWAEQQVKYTEEILFLTKTLQDSEDEIYEWRKEWLKMLDAANKWKKLYFKEKGIIL